MNLLDYILIFILAAIVFSIVYFNFIKKRFSSCNFCSQYQACSTQAANEMKKYYLEACEKESSSCGQCN